MFGLFKKKATPELPKLTVEELETKYASEIARLVKPAAELIETDAPARSHYGGGAALLSPDFSWPQHEGKPLLLVVQIDFAEVLRDVPELRGSLPDAGVLQLFFDDARDWVGELEPDDEGPLQAYLHLDHGNLRLARGPGFPSEGSNLRFKPRKTLPDEFLMELEDDTDEFRERYICFNGQIGGWANPVQNDPGEDGRVLLLQFSIDGYDDELYLTCAPGPLTEGRLEDARFELQHD